MAHGTLRLPWVILVPRENLAWSYQIKDDRGGHSIPSDFLTQVYFLFLVVIIIVDTIIAITIIIVIISHTLLFII